MLEMLAIFALCLMLPVAYGQAANVDAKATYTWTLPANDTNGAALTGALALTKMQAWVKTASIADTDASAPTAELAASATTFVFTTVVPNGSFLYGRFRACNAQACSALSAQAAKGITISIPGVPTGINVVVTVTVSSQ
jgi:hypothetical protein